MNQSVSAQNRSVVEYLFDVVVELVQIWVASTVCFRTICRKLLLVLCLRKTNSITRHFEAFRLAATHHGWWVGKDSAPAEPSSVFAR